MTLIVEDGTAVFAANSYSPVADITTYLTDRNRQTENSWSTAGTPAQEAAAIEATDFIEQRWGQRFLGRKQFRDVSAARATLTLIALPTATETVVIGTTTFTFGTTVAIGATVSDTLDNLITVVNGSLSLTLTATAGVGDTMIVEAVTKGTGGNSIVTTETLADGSWSSATLVGGSDIIRPQGLSFPRLDLIDRDGLEVRGIPAKLKAAVAEYAVRAVSATITLMPDPVMDDTGRTVVRKKEKVGPIEEETEYEEGGALSQVLRPYPAADRLLAEYIASAGRVIRG